MSSLQLDIKATQRNMALSRRMHETRLAVRPSHSTYSLLTFLFFAAATTLIHVPILTTVYAAPDSTTAESINRPRSMEATENQKTLKEQIEEFRSQLDRKTVALHMTAQQQQAQKRAVHYQRHQQKAQQLYEAHRQSLRQRDLMKKQPGTSIQEGVDLYFDHLTRNENVYMCGSTDGQRIHIDRVNDNVCDCCDGSDEPKESGCPIDLCKVSKNSGPGINEHNTDAEDVAIKEVRAWMNDNGIVSRVLPSMIGKTSTKRGRYRGMIAKENIKTGDIVMRVPQHLILSHLSTSIFSKTAGPPDSIFTEQRQMLVGMKKYLDPNAYLALLLLHELNALAVLAPHSQDPTSGGKGSKVSSSPYKKKNQATRNNKPRVPKLSKSDLLRGTWLSSLPSYVKSIFHSALDWSWLQQQLPATGLLLDLSRSSQDYAVNAYHQIRMRLVDTNPQLFPPSLYSLVRFSHAYTLVNSRCVAATNVSEWKSGADGKAPDATPKDTPASTTASESTTFPIIVPVADFFNHLQTARSGVEAKVKAAHEEARNNATFDESSILRQYPQFRFDAPSHEFVVHAGKDYNKGEEVFIVYGVGWSLVEGHITDGGLGSRAHFAHHYGFLPTSSEATSQQAGSPLALSHDNEHIHIDLEYMLANDQSACQGATQTGKLEPWRRGLLAASGFTTRNHVSFSSADGSLGQEAEDLALLRLWTVCPGFALHAGTREILRATHAREMLERNNEVAVHWMIVKTLDALLLDHPTSLWEDRRKLHGMLAAGSEGAGSGVAGTGLEDHTKRGPGTDTTTDSSASVGASLQPDLMLSVEYTVWVKQTVHKIILRSLKKIADIYRDATDEWLKNELEKFPAADTGPIASHMQHRSNVESYTHWVEQMEKWLGLWSDWSKNVNVNVEL